MFTPVKGPPAPPFSHSASTSPPTYTLVATKGTYTISGKAAALLYKAIIKASAGTYALNGAAANLIYTPLGPPPTPTIFGPQFEIGGGGGAPPGVHGKFGRVAAAMRKREHERFIAILPMILTLIADDDAPSDEPPEMNHKGISNEQQHN